MENKNHVYLLFILILSAFALIILAIPTLFSLSQETQTILDYADFLICILFFFDFLITLFLSKNKIRYFLTWGWLDLASCIPTIDILRCGRMARMARIFRVLRGLRSARTLASFLLKRRAQSTFLGVSLLSIMLITVSAISVFHFESETESNIKTPEDALWWSMTTITTVGYGDKYPVTPEGRMVAAILMAGGVGLFGTFSGFIASWLLVPRENHQTSELDTIRKELIEMKILLERISREDSKV